MSPPEEDDPVVPRRYPVRQPQKVVDLHGAQLQHVPDGALHANIRILVFHKWQIILAGRNRPDLDPLRRKSYPPARKDNLTAVVCRLRRVQKLPLGGTCDCV